MRRLIIVASLLFVLGIMNAESKTWLLPDWQGAGIETRRFDGDGNRDEPLCAEAVDSDGYRLYHKATRCSAPKIFDEYCPYSDEWISECYCPENFANNCVGSYKGDTRITDPKSGYSSCDGLWVACCNYTCPSGTSSDDPGGCGGYTYNGCGERCYYPYQECCTPSSDETGCSYGTEDCDDGCSGTRKCCKACSYSTIASDCSNQCKNVGSNSCSINGTTYYDSCGSSLCSSDQVCYNGSCCTPDDFEWPEPACGCDGWAEEDVGCGLTVSYCRKPKECGDNFVSNCEGTIMECGGLSCCCPTGQCYDDYGANMCDCPTGSAK